MAGADRQGRQARAAAEQAGAGPVRLPPRKVSVELADLFQGGSEEEAWTTNSAAHVSPHVPPRSKAREAPNRACPGEPQQSASSLRSSLGRHHRCHAPKGSQEIPSMEMGAPDTHLYPFCFLTGSRPQLLSIVLQQVTPIVREEATCFDKQGEHAGSSNFL